jgi:hypothetical protein
MRKHLLAMTGAAALGLATAVSGTFPAGAIQLAPGFGSAVDTNVIQIQRDGRGGGDAGARSGGQPGMPDGMRGGGRGGDAVNTGQLGTQGPQVERNVERQNVQRENVQRQDVQRDRQRASSPRNVNRDSRAERRGYHVERRGDHRPIRRGWSRDRHAFYGAYVLGVPFGYATYASHPCYSWLIGPHGAGYYWDYSRCPI